MAFEKNVKNKEHKKTIQEEILQELAETKSNPNMMERAERMAKIPLSLQMTEKKPWVFIINIYPISNILDRLDSQSYYSLLPEIFIMITLESIYFPYLFPSLVLIPILILFDIYQTGYM